MKRHSSVPMLYYKSQNKYIEIDIDNNTYFLINAGTISLVLSLFR